MLFLSQHQTYFNLNPMSWQESIKDKYCQKIINIKLYPNIWLEKVSPRSKSGKLKKMDSSITNFIDYMLISVFYLIESHIWKIKKDE